MSASLRSSPASEWICCDALGATDHITNASQVEQVAYRYWAFGEQTVVSGSNPNRVPGRSRVAVVRTAGP